MSENVLIFPGAQPAETVAIVPIDSVDTARALETAGRLGRLGLQYGLLLPDRAGATDEVQTEDDQIGPDADDMRDQIMSQIAATCRGGGWTMAQFERALSDLWHAAHDWANADGRIFGADADLTIVTAD